MDCKKTNYLADSQEKPFIFSYFNDSAVSMSLQSIVLKNYLTCPGLIDSSPINLAKIFQKQTNEKHLMNHIKHA